MTTRATILSPTKSPQLLQVARTLGVPFTDERLDGQADPRLRRMGLPQETTLMYGHDHLIIVTQNGHWGLIGEFLTSTPPPILTPVAQPQPDALRPAPQVASPADIAPLTTATPPLDTTGPSAPTPADPVSGKPQSRRDITAHLQQELSSRKKAAALARQR